MYKIHLISNRLIDQNDPINIEYYRGVSRVKLYKFKIQEKKVYHIELMYIKNFVFIKFYPSILINNQNKFKIVGMNLSLSEIRGVFQTCSDLIKDEFNKNGDKYNYAFIGQPYDKDNLKKRFISKRFMAYTKQVSTNFMSEKILHFQLDEFNFYSISQKNKINFKKDIELLLNFLKENISILETICTNEAFIRLGS